MLWDALGRSGDALGCSGMLRERSGDVLGHLRLLWDDVGGGGDDDSSSISIYTNSRSTAHAAVMLRISITSGDFLQDFFY